MLYVEIIFLPRSRRFFLVFPFRICRPDLRGDLVQALYPRRGSSTLSQTVVVTAFLFGLAAGAFWIGRLADRIRSPLLGYSYCEIAIGIFGLLIPYEIVVLRWISASIYPAMQSYLALQFAVRFLLTFLVIGPPCILMGGTLPC
jgi:spermidine synthase